MTSNSFIKYEEAVTSTFWGGKRVELPDEYKSFIQQVFGFEDLEGITNRIKAAEEKQFPLEIPKTNLSEDLQDQLRKIPECSFTTAALERFIFSSGMSYFDLLNKRNGRISNFVDGIAQPQTIKALRVVITIANDNNIILIPTGGKSSVTEAITPVRVSLAVDLLHLNKIINFQPENKLLEVEAGVLLPDIENWLEKRNFILGHSPQSFISTSVGGAIASRGAGHFSSYFGPMRRMVHSLTVETPKGTFIERTNVIPESAVGPSLSELFIGSEGTLGIISKVLLYVKPTQRKRFKAYLFKSFSDGVKAIKEFYQKGLHPATVRLSDSYETEQIFSIMKKGDIKNRLAKIYLDYRGYDTNHRCIMMLYEEGESNVTKKAFNEISTICNRHGGLSLGKSPAMEWYKTRFDLPYLRENFLEYGLLIDTIETATTYDKLEHLHDETLKTLMKYSNYAMAHVSHVYEEGASLYFTFLAKEDFNWENPLITRIRRDVIQGFLQHGGTISHHHGVGRAGSEYLPLERLEVANGILLSVKKYLDPKGIMNPSAGLFYDKKS